MTYGNATGVCEAVARADYEVIKGVVRMKFERGALLARAVEVVAVMVDAETYRYKMAGDVLGGVCEALRAVIAEKLDYCLIGASDLHRAAVQVQELQVVEPTTCVYRIQDLRPLENFGEDIFNFPRLQKHIPLCIQASWEQQ